MLWALAVGTEIVFWAATLVGLLARYWWRRPVLAAAMLVVVVLDQLGLLAIAVVQLATTGRVTSLQIAVLVLLAYGLTAGREKAKKLDARVQAWVDQRLRRDASVSR